VFDVFTSDGRFRGQVVAPVALQLAPYPVVGSDKVWAVPKDADGAPYVTQHRFVVD
jgi:hypothetical protein